MINWTCHEGKKKIWSSYIQCDIIIEGVIEHMLFKSGHICSSKSHGNADLGR